VRGFVAPTDHSWYQYLRARPHLEEVNFWRPGGGSFAALSPGEPFFFKLKSPNDAIGGFGQFARFTRLPLWMAWDVFGEANGVPDLPALQARLARLSSSRKLTFEMDHPIGCISVAFPTFFAPDEWVPLPSDWKPNIVSGRTYDLAEGPGRLLWGACVERAVSMHQSDAWTSEAAQQLRHGKPQMIEPRLGQASFRLAVLDAYGGACAVTTEHSLPVLEAAHIRPYSQGGAHAVSNGIPLRRDLHRLFDLGFVTVRRNRRVAVSRQLREDWANGRTYYALEGQEIVVPRDPADQPDPTVLEWHADVIFRG
jgi:putative restriction endonuclease